jgi:hypothetical protein
MSITIKNRPNFFREYQYANRNNAGDQTVIDNLREINEIIIQIKNGKFYPEINVGGFIIYSDTIRKSNIQKCFHK